VFCTVQGLELRLSEKDAEIAAARDRLEMVEQRQTMEMDNLSQSLKVCTPHSYFNSDDILLCNSMWRGNVLVRALLRSPCDTKVADSTPSCFAFR